MSRLGRIRAGVERMVSRATGIRDAAQREQQRREQEAAERGAAAARGEQDTAPAGSDGSDGSAAAKETKEEPAPEPAGAGGESVQTAESSEQLAARARRAVLAGSPELHPPVPPPVTGATAVPPAGGPPPPIQPVVVTADGRPPPSSVVPWGVRVAAEAGWRLLVLAGVVWVLVQIVSSISLLVMSFTAALFITALLQPVVGLLKRLGVSRGLATAITAVGGLAIMGLIGWFVVWQVIENSDDLTEQVQDGIDRLRDWILDLPFEISEENLDEWVDSVQEWINENQDTITSAGVEAANYVVEILTGMGLTLFVVLFLLYDGNGVWQWFLKLMPAAARPGIAGAGPRAWITLTGYVRGTVIVALIDAIGIGLGLFFLDVPLAVPLAVIVFLASFVPLVGAIASGALAVVVALVTNGMVDALIVLGVVLLVQQIEGHVLQPFILGRMVRVHPLAVVLGVAAGSMLAGIPGAVVAVPLIAVTNTVASYLKAYHEETLRRGAGEGPHSGATIAELAPTPPPASRAEREATGSGGSPEA